MLSFTYKTKYVINTYEERVKQNNFKVNSRNSIECYITIRVKYCINVSSQFE